MIDLESRILAAKKALGPLRDKAIEQCVAVLLSHLQKKECPGQTDITAGRDAAEAAVKTCVFSPEWLSAMNGGNPVSREDAASLRLSFDAVASPLAVPAPQVIVDLSAARLAIAAAVGAVGGMMILAPLTRVLLDMRDTGVFVGAPLGAFLLVLAVWQAARHKGLRTFLKYAFGGALLVEVLAILTSGSILGWLRPLWILLGNRRSGVWRVLVYTGVIFVLVLTKPRPRYDRAGYEQTIRSAVEQWVDGAITAVSVLGHPADTRKDRGADYEGMLYTLVHKIQPLRRVPPESLPAAVQELLESVRDMEFEEALAKTFEWQEDMREKYEAFGHIEPGDLVQVEEPPVVLEGTLRRKGLVRKARGGR